MVNWLKNCRLGIRHKCSYCTRRAISFNYTLYVRNNKVIKAYYYYCKRHNTREIAT